MSNPTGLTPQQLARLIELRDALRELHAKLEYAALQLRLQQRRLTQ